MKRIETTLPGVFVVEPVVHKDERGFFFESYQETKFAQLGISNRFVQDNHSKSIKNTLRGLHYQVARPQAKLCRVIQGEVLDVVVDIRLGSPAFGQHTTVVLTAENMKQVYIPEGFAHGYLVLSETAEFLYKCSDFYFPEHERGVIWDDPEIAINWGIENPIISAKDRAYPVLSKIHSNDLPRFA